MSAPRAQTLRNNAEHVLCAQADLAIVGSCTLIASPPPPQNQLMHSVRN